MVSEQVVKLTSWVRMAPKKNRKQPQDSVMEEPVDDQVAPPESMGEEPMPREDQDEPESEEEQRSSVVATPLWPSVGVKPHTPEVGDLESSGTPECLEFDSRG